MTLDELNEAYEAAGLRYHKAKDELLASLVEVAALHLAVTSPAATRLGGPGELPGFGHDLNILPSVLAHPTAAPYEGRKLSGEIIERTSELVESLRANPAAA